VTVGVHRRREDQPVRRRTPRTSPGSAARADTVISPASIVGHLLVAAALGEDPDADIDIDSVAEALSRGTPDDGR